MKNFFQALQFLTRLNVDQPFDQDRVGSSMVWFPAVGLLMGCLLVVVYKTSLLLFPSIVADMLCLIFLIWFTRALHLDGFCDLVDGFYVGGEKKRILEIMDDSQIGSMAAVALWALLTLKFVALSALDPALKISGLILMPIVSRWMIVLSAKISNYAKEEEGLGKLFIEQLEWLDFWAATSTAVVCLLAILGFMGIQLGILVVTVTLGMVLFINQQIGGMTGDTLGAISEIVEVAFLLGLLAAGS